MRNDENDWIKRYFNQLWEKLMFLRKLFFAIISHYSGPILGKPSKELYYKEF